MSSNLISDLIQINLIKGNIKNAIETKGQTVTNFASYPVSIENIVSGGNGVKQYDSLENMYADVSNAHNGDLATVYASSQAPITDTTEFQVATFPQTVVLDEALSDYVEVGFQALDESVMFDCWGNLDSDYFRMDCYTDDGDIRIQYESQDGITYNRTRFMKNDEDISGNEVDFGTLIKFGNREGGIEFNSAISKFIITGTTVFDGLFQYNGTNFNLLPNTGLTVNIEDVYKGRFYGQSGIQNGTFNKTTSLNLTELKSRVNLYSNLSSLKLDETVTNIKYLFNGLDIKYIPDLDTHKVIQMCSAFAGCSNLISVPNFDTSNVTNMYSMFQYDYNLMTVPNFDTSNVISMQYMFGSCYNLVEVPNFNTSNVTNMSNMFSSCNNLVNVPQFNVSNVRFISCAFAYCNNLSNASIQNIINMCLNSNVYHWNSMSANLNVSNSLSPLYSTKFNSLYYSNRLSELRAAGWSY